MPDVFEVLRQDHDEVKAMLAVLEAGFATCSPGAAGIPDGETHQIA